MQIPSISQWVMCLVQRKPLCQTCCSALWLSTASILVETTLLITSLARSTASTDRHASDELVEADAKCALSGSQHVASSQSLQECSF